MALCDHDAVVGFRFGDFVLDDATFALSGPAGPVHVEPQVFELLLLLVVNHDRVVPKEELLDTIWGDRF
ncbi:winged helix-turn-helix domain-containing protein, partial [Salmonella sp. SAL4446]|uniref:winged helix-turn-helix domain-containing protein n=1 Tax=Salmonella sp. SAL4446 TaxID=3159901 RepID=UPI0039786FB1